VVAVPLAAEVVWVVLAQWLAEQPTTETIERTRQR
jgi:hypothetical protein